MCIQNDEFCRDAVDPTDPAAQMKALKDAGLAPNFVEHLIMDPPAATLEGAL